MSRCLRPTFVCVPASAPSTVQCTNFAAEMYILQSEHVARAITLKLQ